MSDFTKNVLVLGGGVAGLSAARALHERGVGVHLAEKRDRLGGKASQWACMATDVCQNCGACLSAELADCVPAQDHTEIYTNTELSSLGKNGDGFEAALAGDTSKTVNVDAVLVATGFEAFNPSALRSLGYGQNNKVITTAELNELMKAGRLQEVLPESDAPSIAFIQCVGSRNRKLDRNYCSQVCCKISLRHANKLLHLYPEADISVFHMDLQIIGKEFRCLADDLSGRVKLVQGVCAEIVSDREEGKATLFHEDESTGVRTAYHFDLVVLSVGLGASEKAGELAEKLGIAPDSFGFFSQSEDALPSGVYAAGAARGPMNIATAIEQGRVAADKIAWDLGLAPEAARRTATAVIGGGQEALTVAKTLSENGHPAIMIDPGEGESASEGGFERIAGAKLASVEGSVGNYTLRVQTGDNIRKIGAGAIVVASGAARVAPGEAGGSDKIVSLQDFQALSEAQVPEKVAFRIDHFGHENKENARLVLENALALARKGSRAYVVMRKMLVDGLSGQERYDAARKAGVKFLRAAGNRVEISTEADGVKMVLQDETLPGMDIAVSADMLVVAEKTAPGEDARQLATILKQPLDAEGFIQSANSRHRLVGSPRRGIFFAGNCHDECDGTDLANEISAIMAGLDYLAKNGPPAGDPVEIVQDECIKCLTCLRVCPHGAVILQDTAKPRIVNEACFECGICVSNCPAKAIRQEGFSDAKIAGEGTVAETFVFACERSAGLAAEEAARLGMANGDKVHVQKVRCAGRVGLENMFAPLLQGAKRVIVAGCHEGNCRSMDGGTYAKARIESTAKDVGIGPDKLCFHPVAANEPDTYRKIVSEEE